MLRTLSNWPRVIIIILLISQCLIKIWNKNSRLMLMSILGWKYTHQQLRHFRSKYQELRKLTTYKMLSKYKTLMNYQQSKGIR
jgi:hypothetical protein